MNLVRNGVGRENRLVLLGSFRTHEVFEISLPQARLGLARSPFFLGVKPETAPEAPPSGIGLERIRRLLRFRAIIGGRGNRTKQDQGQSNTDVQRSHFTRVCGRFDACLM